MGAGDGPAASGLNHHVGQSETRQVLAHVISHVSPDAEQDALALMVTGTVLVGLAKVSGRDGPIDRGHDLRQGDGLRGPGQDVPAAHAALGPYEPHALQAQENLLEVGLGETGTFGQVANRGGLAVVVAKGQTEQRPTGVVPPCGYSHGAILSTVGLVFRGRARSEQSHHIVWHTAVVTDQSPNDVNVNPDQVLSPGESEPAPESDNTDYVSQPAKVMRIGSMVKQLLDEARSAPLDEAGRLRLREIYEMSISELSGALSPDLSKELSRVAIPFTAEVPSESELRIAQAQLVGWLEGLFHGIQASLFAQQAAAAAQLEKMRDRSLPPGTGEPRAGTYL
jgi:Protein of unknown function (DUF2587)